MRFRRIREWLREFWFQHRPHWGYEEPPMSEEEIEELDRTQPGWDRDARLARCEYGLHAGESRAVLVAIYGEEMVREAEDRVATEK